jgi:excisionase family DNA binding protein
MIDSTEVATAAQAQPEVFIDKPEVAKRMKRTVRTIDNLMKRRLIPFYKIGRSVSFKWSEIESHLRNTCRVAGRGSK